MKLKYTSFMDKAAAAIEIFRVFYIYNSSTSNLLRCKIKTDHFTKKDVINSFHELE